MKPIVLALALGLASCSAPNEPSAPAIDPALAEMLRDVPKELLTDPLLLAAVRGDAGEVRRLLEAGREPEAAASPDDALVLVLHHRQCSSDVVKALVQGGADPDVTLHDTGTNTLLMAAGSGATDCFRTLLALGADPSQLDVNGNGVIASAYLSPDRALFDWMMRGDYSPPRRAEDLGRSLQIALKKEDWQNCHTLLAHGASLESVAAEGPSAPGPEAFAALDRCRSSAPGLTTGESSPTPAAALSTDPASQEAWSVRMLRDNDCSGDMRNILVGAYFHPSRHGARISDHRSWRAAGLSATTAALPEDDSTEPLIRFMFNPEQYRSKSLFAHFRGQLLCDAPEQEGRVFRIDSVSDVRIE